MRWIGIAAQPYRRPLEELLNTYTVAESFLWVERPEEIRRIFLQAMPGECNALVGPDATNGVPINLAAALAEDGHANAVVVAQPEPSGSFRSRAKQAGIASVIDITSIKNQLEAGVDRQPTGAFRVYEPQPPQRPVSSNTGSINNTAQSVNNTGQFAQQQAMAPVGNRAVPSDSAVLNCDTVHARRPNPCPILVAASGRGGVGKSALSCVMACVAARWGLKVSLCDFDLACGNDFAYLGLSGPAALDSLGDVEAVGEQAVAQCGKMATEGVSLWGPCERPENAELVAPYAGTLLSLVAARSDLVIVDVGTAWNDAAAQAAQMCDRLLLICPEFNGMAASLSRVGGLAVRLGVARTRIIRVINLCNPKKVQETFVNRADQGLEAARTIRVIDGGLEADELIQAGHVPELVKQNPEMIRSAEHLLASVLQEMGHLPSVQAAHKALQYKQKGTKHHFFGRKKEAV